MKSGRFGWMGTGIAVMLILPLFTGCISFTSKEKSPSVNQSTAPPAGPLKTQVTQEELQSAVISYANRFIATIGQASFIFEKELPTPQVKITASNRRVYSLLAVTEIAAGPNPGAALLDMLVITSLSRIVWDEYWRPRFSVCRPPFRYAGHRYC
jgi:hypothetical protein